MSAVKRQIRKQEDRRIVTMNSLGMSLGTIGKEIGKHPSTVTGRLSTLGISPADTRRAFMEEVFFGLSQQAQKWLSSQVGPHMPVRQLISNMISDAAEKAAKSQQECPDQTDQQNEEETQ